MADTARMRGTRTSGERAVYEAISELRSKPDFDWMLREERNDQRRLPSTRRTDSCWKKTYETKATAVWG